jgi:acetylornithine deacetylase/succinyl-diaminopimelate desuccinylase-like protein
MGIGECQVDFDLRTLPGMTRETIEADLDWALYRLMIEDPQLDVSFNLWPHSTGPFELPRGHMLFQVFREAHKEVFGDDLIVDIDAKGTSLNRMIDRCKYGETDMGNFHAAGIPGCLYGPGEASTTPDERVSIPQLVKHCKVTALVSAAICKVP